MESLPSAINDFAFGPDTCLTAGFGAQHLGMDIEVPSLGFFSIPLPLIYP